MTIVHAMSIDAEAAAPPRRCSERPGAATAVGADLDRLRPMLTALRKSDALWDWDLSGNTIHVSSRWKEIAGCEGLPFGNRPEDWLARVHPDDDGILRLKIAEHLEKKTGVFEAEYRILRNEWTDFWVKTRGAAVRDASGKALRIAGVTSDINRRRHFEIQESCSDYMDPVTGLPNRNLFLMRLAGAEPGSYAIFVLDLDRFRSVNERFGHAGGNAVLAQFGRRLKRCFRADDTVAHLGGDQFVVMCHGLKDCAQGHTIFKRIQQLSLFPYLLNDEEISLKVSVGMAASDERREKPFAMVRFAQDALNHARAGRFEKMAGYDRRRWGIAH